MKGSDIKNIKFDNDKQKIVYCQVCEKPLVVGKFAKTKQSCNDCKNINKSKSTSYKKPSKKENGKDSSESGKFAARLVELAQRLDFDLDAKRVWRKKYASSDGGITYVYIMIEPGVAGQEPRVEYFSVITQRAIGLEEDFRKFLPPDAASDCEVIAEEFGVIKQVTESVGQTECAMCGEYTDQFGIDPKRDRILCITPNNCFKKSFTGVGAESEQ